MTQGRKDDGGWSDPRNWRGGWLGLYDNERDARLWVRKKPPGWGWTLNLGHRHARRVIALLLALGTAGIAAAVFLETR